MTDWIAPSPNREREPFTGPERQMLEGWLDWDRQPLLGKCAGLTAEQLKTASTEPSNLSLLGLLRHMTEVERWWFIIRAAGQTDAGDIYNSDETVDGDFDDVADADAEADHAAFVAEVRAADQAVA